MYSFHKTILILNYKRICTTAVYCSCTSIFTICSTTIKYTRFNFCNRTYINPLRSTVFPYI
nr:MAG TPA: hypothetical protein [Caudoviricetes sp.]DAN87444.1 MAG TPA: hypothetical protein [Caudoviricetes sp.]